MLLTLNSRQAASSLVGRKRRSVSSVRPAAVGQCCIMGNVMTRRRRWSSARLVVPENPGADGRQSLWPRADVIDCHRSSIASVIAINVLVVPRRQSQTAPPGAWWGGGGVDPYVKSPLLCTVKLSEL